MKTWRSGQLDVLGAEEYRVMGSIGEEHMRGGPGSILDMLNWRHRWDS